jgi:signal peptidase I
MVKMKLSDSTKVILKEIAITLGLAGVIYLLFHIFILNAIVHMSSMEPTLLEGQRLFAAKQFLDPGRGDIVIIQPPISPDEDFVKRLIGLPGDTILIKNKTVSVNGVVLDEPYLMVEPNYSYGPFKVPEGRYFVLGDNRNNSTDSHYNWTVTRDEILAKAVFRYWPLNKFGLVGNYNLNEQVESVSSLLPSAPELSPPVAALPRKIEVAEIT